MITCLPQKMPTEYFLYKKRFVLFLVFAGCMFLYCFHAAAQTTTIEMYEGTNNLTSNGLTTVNLLITIQKITDNSAALQNNIYKSGGNMRNVKVSNKLPGVRTLYVDGIRTTDINAVMLAGEGKFKSQPFFSFHLLILALVTMTGQDIVVLKSRGYMNT